MKGNSLGKVFFNRGEARTEGEFFGEDLRFHGEGGGRH